MKQHLVFLAAAVAVAVAVSSCAYDPYYAYAGGPYSSGYGYGNGYGSGYGYGEGYGYGGSAFSTSIFVGTGDPQWGYDPYCSSYYDYHRRCYYDPYLNGYYPLGYRPPVIIGVPHPYGWRPGHGYCPPPRRVHDGMIANYHNREGAYRSTNYTWARQVRVQPLPNARMQGQHSNLTPSNRINPAVPHAMNYNRDGRLNTAPRTFSGTFNGQVQGRNINSQQLYSRQGNSNPMTNYSSRQFNPGPRTPQFQSQPRRIPQQGYSNGGPPNQHSFGNGGANRQLQSKPPKEAPRGMRGLGQG